MNRVAFLLLLFWVCDLTTGFSETHIEGAWLHDGTKWSLVPGSGKSDVKFTEAEILYFANGGKFGLADVTLLRSRKEHVTISHGDGQAVYKGEWSIQGATVSISYRLVEVSILPVGQSLPGPIRSGTIKMDPKSLLTFEGKTFRRAPALDESARETIYGLQAR